MTIVRPAVAVAVVLVLAWLVGFAADQGGWLLVGVPLLVGAVGGGWATWLVRDDRAVRGRGPLP